MMLVPNIFCTFENSDLESSPYTTENDWLCGFQRSCYLKVSPYMVIAAVLDAGLKEFLKYVRSICQGTSSSISQTVLEDVE